MKTDNLLMHKPERLLMALGGLSLLGDISIQNTKTLMLRLLAIDALGTPGLVPQNKPFNMYLSSDGGDYFVALGLYDLLKHLITEHKINVHIRCFGQVSSAAILVLSAGTTRRALPNTRFLLHKVYDEDESGLEKSDNEETEKFLRLVFESTNTDYREVLTQVNNNNGEFIFDTETAKTLGILTQ